MIRKMIFLGFLFLPFSPACAEEETLRFYDKALDKFSQAPGIASDINIDVNGTAVRTTVIQYFANNTDQWQEGVYSYPLPDDAAVDHLVMVIGGRRVAGFVAEKEKARQIYEKAKREGHAAALSEQHRANMFKTSVANIPPRSVIAIEIAYQGEVAVDGHDFTLRVPLAITPRYDHFEPKDFLTLASAEGGSAARDVMDRLALFDFSGANNPVALHVMLHPGFEVGKIDSPSDKITGGEEDGDVMDITTADNILPGDHDFVLHWMPRETGKPLAFLDQEQVDGQTYSHLMILPPEKIVEQAARPRAVTMIIDVSGSMGGPSIEQAKASLIEALGDLKPGDQFNVISFQSVTNWLFEAPVPVTDDNIKTALKWVAALEADGGTEMQPAVEHALAEKYDPELLRQIVFITDGAIGYETELGAYIRDHAGKARFYAVGIGAAPNAWLMKMIAMQGRGTFTFISDVKETGEKMKALFCKMKAPVLTDLQVSFPGSDTAEIIPAEMPDLMAGEPVSIAIRSGAPVHDVVLAGKEGGKDWQYKMKDSKTAQASGVGKIYARRKIQDLKFTDPANRNPDTAKQTLALGLEHQLITDYTSLVAVDEEVLRPAGIELVSVRHDPTLPRGWTLAQFDPRKAAESYDALLKKKAEDAENRQDQNFNLPHTATGWQGQFMAGVLMLLFALAVRRKYATVH